MNEQWSNVIISGISVAVHVDPNSGKPVHKNRQFHGFVFNDEGSIKDYYFDDGSVMHTEGGDLFYLPKGSSYHVKTVTVGGCYAINFDANIDCAPFVVKSKSVASLKNSFKTACADWKSSSPAKISSAMRTVYDCIYIIQKKHERNYMPNDKNRLIAPAIEAIERDFTSVCLTVSALAELCSMSEVYFRKIFLHMFGISPKEYLIRKRMEYAKQLIELGELEISKIAEMCGYSEPCHFSREFKKRFGISPNNYS